MAITSPCITHSSSFALPHVSLSLSAGDTFYNVDKKEKVKIPRLVRMHSDKMEDIEQAGEWATD